MNDDLPPRIWTAWRVSIKRLFDQGILIREIVAAIPEAGDVRKWPHGTAYWRRVGDVVWKNRREGQLRTVRVTGMEGLGELITKRQRP